MKKFTRTLNGNWNWWSPRYKVYFGWHQITIGARGDAIGDIFGDVRVLRRHQRFEPIVCRINCYWVDAVMHQIIKIYSRRSCPSAPTRERCMRNCKLIWKGRGVNNQRSTSPVFITLLRFRPRVVSKQATIWICANVQPQREHKNGEINCLISRIKFHNSAFWAALVIVLPLPFCARK